MTESHFENRSAFGPATRSWVRDTTMSPDFVLGVLAVVAAWITIYASQSLQDSAVPVQLLYGFIALGVAVLGVSLTSVAILVGGLGDQYLQILDKAGGIRAALQPIKTVATVGAVTVAASVCGALLWTVGYQLRPGAFAIPAGFAVWTFVGALQVVNLIAFHGEQRGRFIVQTDEAKRQLKSVKDIARG